MAEDDTVFVSEIQKSTLVVVVVVELWKPLIELEVELGVNLVSW